MSKPTKEKLLSIITTSNGHEVTEETILSNTTLLMVDYISITREIDQEFNSNLTVYPEGFDKWVTVGDYVNYVLKQ